MSEKLDVQWGQSPDGAVVFINPKNSKTERFAYEHPVEEEKAVSILKSDINARHNVTRAALTCLTKILALQRVEGYKGQGKIGEDGKLSNELKTAMRDAESEYFKPQFQKTEQLDVFLTQLREAGTYAVVKGVALKYFYFCGKLPCAYNNDGTPDTNRLISVPAMQKLMRMMDERKPEPKTWADKVNDIHLAWIDARDDSKGTVTDRNLMAGLRARLEQFHEDVHQWINQLDAAATQASAALMKAQTNPAESVPVEQEHAKIVQAPSPAAKRVPAKTQVKQSESKKEKIAAKG